MLITVVIIFIACLLPVVVFAAARRRSSLTPSSSELASRLLPVDIEAFCNLVDPDEEQFLRSNLPPALFRSVQRERLLAATDYVSAVSRNAVILTRMGEGARGHADAAIARAAQQLADNAVRLRLHCFFVTVNLWAAIVMPGTGLMPNSFVERYRQLNGLTRTLLHLRAPVNGSRASLSAG